MKIYNNLEIEIDDTEVENLTQNDILYLSLDGSKFSELNYINQYEILKFIKSGGYGEVLLAKNKITNQKVSIKKIDLNGFSTEDLYSISREALYLSSLQHKNIIKIYGSFAYKNYLYNVMEYAEGGELTQLIRSNEELSENRIKDIFKQIYEGVQFIHENEVIHRDLKPNNILFLDKEKTQVVIIDFGISGISNCYIKEVIKAGTFKFLSPEILFRENLRSRYPTDDPEVFRVNGKSYSDNYMKGRPIDELHNEYIAWAKSNNLY
jgi:serine/threonine protein kinase